MFSRTKIGAQMIRNCAVTLGLIAALIVVNFGVMDHLIHRQMENEKLLVTSSAQSTLSQRIPLIARRLVDATDVYQRQMVRSELTTARDSFWQAHVILSGQTAALDAPTGTGPAQIYFSSPHRLDQQSREFVGLIDAILAASPGAGGRDVAALGELAHTPLLASLNAAMMAQHDLFQHEIEHLRSWQFGVVALTLASLVVIGLFVFAPMVRRVESITESLMAARQEMEHSALHDPLTGLPNRRYLDDFLVRALAIARRNGHIVGVLHIDLDRFKDVNDKYGHKAGDAVLQATARIMLASVRTSDFVARVGGDEFVIVSPETRHTDGLNTLAQRLIDRLSVPMPYEQHLTEVNASIGIAIATPEVDTDAERLMIAADIALYQAKHNGRAQYRVYAPGDVPMTGGGAPQLTVIAGGGRN